MGLSGWRDLALIVICLMYAVLSLGTAVVMFFVLKYGRRGLSTLNRLLEKTGRPKLQQLTTQLASVRDATSHLPGNTPVVHAPESGPKRLLGGFPFRRKKRPFPLSLLKR